MRVKNKENSGIQALTSAQKAKLKGLAHHLKPLIQIGNQGFTENVKNEIALALDKHELIKIQLPPESSAKEKEEQKVELLAILPKKAHFVNRIGRTVILYLEKEKKQNELKSKKSR